MSVKDIENAMTQLAPEELNELVAWLADYQETVWDEPIKQDLDTGRLDAISKEGKVGIVSFNGSAQSLLDRQCPPYGYDLTFYKT